MIHFSQPSKQIENDISENLSNYLIEYLPSFYVDILVNIANQPRINLYMVK
jgi:hypothetical protein